MKTQPGALTKPGVADGAPPPRGSVRPHVVPTVLAPPTSTAAIIEQAWPMFIAQLAVVLNAAIDTAMAGRVSPADLAGVALGINVYVSVFVAFMGVLSALGPVAAHHYGAGKLSGIGHDVGQALWLAAMLSVLGVGALTWTAPWFALAQAPDDVMRVTERYLLATAFGLPGALGARVFVALNSAVSRPKATMAINLTALLLKAPLNALFIDGVGPLPSLGGAGCGVATAVLAWLMLGLSLLLWRLDPFYARFRGRAHTRPRRPQWASQRELLRLGIPIGLGTLFEVTSFTFMAILIARLGAETLGGHQIVSNLAAVLFMVPLSIGFATSALAAQSLGAGSPRGARTIALRGLRLAAGIATAAIAIVWWQREFVIGLYTTDAQVAGIALLLLGWAAAFHLFDALQGVSVFILRGYKVTLSPMVIYGVSLWGLGLGGGYWLAYSDTPAAAFFGAPLGAQGFWAAALISLSLAALALVLLVLRVSKRELKRHSARHALQEHSPAVHS
jgi:MATE family multidrug resistance protein